MWLRWEQAGSGGSDFAGRGETDFAGSKLVAVDRASLVGVKVASLGASWEWWIGLRWWGGVT